MVGILPLADLGGDADVIEDAEALRFARNRMMPRRTNHGDGVLDITGDDRLAGLDCAAHRQPSADVGVLVIVHRIALAREPK